MENQPIRVQLSRAKGWRKPDNTVVVSRPSKWGNPFKIGLYFRCSGSGEGFKQERVSDAEAATRFFAEMLDEPNPNYPTDLSELRGKNLACFCKIGTPCHADVLLRLANSPHVSESTQ